MMRSQIFVATVLILSTVGHATAAAAPRPRAEHVARYVAHDAERSTGRLADRWADRVLARDSLTTITTDTGALAPGDRDFSRYSNLALCLLADLRERTLLRSNVTASAVLDTLHDLQTDTVATKRVAAVAQACGGTRLTVTGTPSLELPFLTLVALDAGDDSVSLAAALRFAAAAPDTTHMLQTLDWAERTFLYDVPPARVALAETVVTRIDALGPSATFAQMAAHARLLNFWMAARNYPRAAAEAERILVTRHRVTSPLAPPDAGRGDGNVLNAYRALMARAFWARTDSLATIARRAQADIRQWLVDPRRERDFADLSKEPVDSVVLDLAPGLYRALASRRHPPPPDTTGCWNYGRGHDCSYLEGRELIPLQADAWFPAAGVDTVQPVPGKVTLEVGADGWCTIAYKVGEEEHCFAPIATAIRRWLARYGAAGLTVTVVIATGDETLMDGAVLPGQFAARARWYFQDYLRLPVTVAVEYSKYVYLPLPDGRRERGDKTQFQQYHFPLAINGYTMLFGRDRRVLYSNWISDPLEWKNEEKTLDEYLETSFAPNAVAGPLAVPRSASPSSPATPGRT